MNKTFRFLGSLSFAIFLITALAVLLIVSTLLESNYGTSFAQRFVYTTGWFDAFLFLVGVNIFCATLLRIPFKKKHTGFITTHIGLLLLLCGSLLSRWTGVDGQMLLYEGQTDENIARNVYEVVVHGPSGPLAQVDLADPIAMGPRKIVDLKNGVSLYVDRISNNMIGDTSLKEGSESDPANHAVILELKSERTGADETLRLAEKDPSDESPAKKSLGPALVELREAPSAKVSVPTLRFLKQRSEIASLQISKDRLDPLPLAGGFLIKDLHYFPNARVGENNTLINSTEEGSNPAVQFELEDGKGSHWKLIRFALFPEFESMHGKEGLPEEIKAEFIVPEAPSQGSSLTLYYQNNEWSYESKSSSGGQSGRIEAGKTYATGWMDFHFTVKQLFNRALISHPMREADKHENGKLAAQVSLVKNRHVEASSWVAENEPERLRNADGEWLVFLKQKSLKLPFQLTLKDFRKVDYPGTSRPASFESDVTLNDPAEKVVIEKTIRMNKPLDYKGFRVFQSSYIQDTSGDASVFTIAKNPGIWFIYFGSIVMFLGIYLTFFVSSLSSLRQ